VESDVSDFGRNGPGTEQGPSRVQRNNGAEAAPEQEALQLGGPKAIDVGWIPECFWFIIEIWRKHKKLSAPAQNAANFDQQGFSGRSSEVLNDLIANDGLKGGRREGQGPVKEMVLQCEMWCPPQG
jgi:hypothetical protein